MSKPFTLSIKAAGLAISFWQSFHETFFFFVSRLITALMTSQHTLGGLAKAFNSWRLFLSNLANNWFPCSRRALDWAALSSADGSCSYYGYCSGSWTCCWTTGSGLASSTGSGCLTSGWGSGYCLDSSYTYGCSYCSGAAACCSGA